METQPGHRTFLVDPFGRELEEWLRDAPAVRGPSVSDLVVPPVTGPILRPILPPVPDAVDEHAPEDALAPAAAFRREQGRHAACAPSFPEPPARLSLTIGDLAVQVSSATGRSTIERIAMLEGELDRRDADLARLAAWHAQVTDVDDPEVAAARAFAVEAFADVLAEAMTARRPRASGTARTRTTQAVPVTPVSAVHAGPVPLVSPATGPNAIDRAAFAAAIRAHADTVPAGSAAPSRASGSVADASTPDVVPAAPGDRLAENAVRPSTWSRVLAAVLRLVGRR